MEKDTSISILNPSNKVPFYQLIKRLVLPFLITCALVKNLHFNIFLEFDIHFHFFNSKKSSYYIS